MKVSKRRALLGSVAAVGVALGAWACAAAQRPDGGSGLLKPGDQVPALAANDQHGKPRSLQDQRGKFVVVFFYPKDGTPGCTTEACAFRDAWDKYEASDVVVFGVSSDDSASHAEFAEEHSLPFPLLADPEHVWSNAFGVSTFLGMTERVSFLIGPDGKVRQTYPDVDPGVHATEVLKQVQSERSK